MRLGIAAVVAALIALAVPGTAAAQFGNLVVDTTADGNDGECGNDCTLREAIALGDVSTGRWVEVPPGVYRLTQGPLIIGNDYVLGGSFLNNRSAGARTTVIDAGGSSRVIHVPSGSTGLFAGVTITGGSADTGGGILLESGSQLTLYDAIVRGNSATARGGGITSAGEFFASTSTISGNTVTSGAGGGVAVEPNSEATLWASTLSGNRAASGGGIATRGTLNLLQSTIAGNVGGGVVVEPAVSPGLSIINTLLAGNQGGACGGAGLTSVFRSNWTGNLDDDGTCFGAGGGTSNAIPYLGALTNNGGPTDTHALLAGSPAVNAGDAQWCGVAGTDQRHAEFVGNCDIGAFEFGGKPPELPLPPPKAGETVNVFEARGRVRIKIPGSDEFFELEQAQQVPVGSTFDTSNGRVTLRAAGRQKAWFYQGVFKLGQTKGRKPLSTMTLSGKLSCGGKANAAAARRKRRLWGDGKGKFRTKGGFSSATVRGTRWLVEDRCDGTLTRVAKGKVAVRDFVRKRTVVVSAGKQYLAKRRR
jgi:CSLREA domain-containing protein